MKPVCDQYGEEKAFDEGGQVRPSGFNALSDEAQELIVSAVVGEFDKTGPPEIPDDVRKELERWYAEG
jgi:hypothetical protein